MTCLADRNPKPPPLSTRGLQDRISCLHPAVRKKRVRPAKSRVAKGHFFRRGETKITAQGDTGVNDQGICFSGSAGMGDACLRPGVRCGRKTFHDIPDGNHSQRGEGAIKQTFGPHSRKRADWGQQTFIPPMGIFRRFASFSIR